MSVEKPKVKVTYTTLSLATEELHSAYEEAVRTAKNNIKADYPNYIGGKAAYADKVFAVHSPIDTDICLGSFPRQESTGVNEAVATAARAFPSWKATPWKDRVALARKAAALAEDRLFQIAAVISLEIGKTRLEAIGEVQEVADLIYYACDQMEANNGYVKELLNESPKHHNRSILKPYGVWAVIAPFNYPAALSGGPTGAALITGNTVVLKPATAAPLSSWLIAQCFIDAGFPPGVFNFITGPGSSAGNALINHPDVAGITFTGSSEIGMHLVKAFAGGKWPRPCVIEMGGKNPTIVTASADLARAAAGCSRSAFGFGGQKCSAGSRIFVHRSRYEELLEGMKDFSKKLIIGDPLERNTFCGPLIDQAAIDRYKDCVARADKDGTVVMGGETLRGGIYEKGYFAAPTIVAGLPADHFLSVEELFLPLVTVYPYTDLAEAIRWANSVEHGLTAGVYAKNKDEIDAILDNIEAGVVYVNKESGATTGAWPGYQAFGGWKKSTSTNKGAGHVYYLASYMREQSQTIID